MLDKFVKIVYIGRTYSNALMILSVEGKLLQRAVGWCETVRIFPRSLVSEQDF